MKQIVQLIEILSLLNLYIIINKHKLNIHNSVFDSVCDFVRKAKKSCITTIYKNSSAYCFVCKVGLSALPKIRCVITGIRIVIY